VAEAQREDGAVRALLRAVDDPAPRVTAAAVAARARAAGAPRGEARRSAALRWAAGVVVAIGIAGVAYAVPGSPLPRWIRAVVQWAGGAPETPPAPPAAETSEPSHVAGIAVAAGERLLVVFAAAQPSGVARVSLSEGDEVVVRAPLGSATFTTDDERLVVHNEGSSASFEIEIPGDAPQIEILVAGERVFLKSGPRVAIGGVDAPGGPYVLPLTPRGRPTP
jgi:hypothetical protein